MTESVQIDGSPRKALLQRSVRPSAANIKPLLTVTIRSMVCHEIG
jgi:hypothetical protein